MKCLDLLLASDLPLTAKNLADRIGLTGGAITGVADRLEAAGFVERVRDPHDRRRWELRVVHALERHGFKVARVNGSHHIMRQPGRAWNKQSRCTATATWQRAPRPAS